MCKTRKRWVVKRAGGEGGIRTHGTDKPYNGFRGRRLQPLGHLSGELEIIANCGYYFQPYYWVQGVIAFSTI